MKILITGAHFTPAQAVIEELRKFPDLEIVYVGRKTTMEGDPTPSAESQILPKMGVSGTSLRVKFIPITTGRLRRFISLGTFVSLLKIPIGLLQAFWIILTEDPDIVVSFGGYIGVPVVICAWIFNKPILLHDQTLVFGLASSISAIFATKIAVTFNTKYPFKKDKLILTGNPMRSSILFQLNQPSLEIERLLGYQKKSKLPMIFLTGGNQGSHLLNQAFSDKLEDLTGKYILVHQTGDSKFKDFEKLAEKAKTLSHPENYFVYKFIQAEDMAAVLKNTDLAISRAGSNTLLELAYLGVVTIIVPYPHLYKNEQVKNARFFADKGLGEVIYQSDFSAEVLEKKIQAMIKNLKHYQQSAKQAKAVIVPDASLKLTQQILVMAHEV